MNKNISLEELLLEFQPFSKELIAWCKENPKFFEALKNIYPDKFISPSAIMISNPPTGDEVIGVYSYHYKLKTPIFKQDFIVNIGKSNNNFILYTRNPNGSSKYVKDINAFFNKYERYGYDRKHHHLTLEELPTQIQGRALRAIALSKIIENLDIKKITQEQINKTYLEVKDIKEKEKYLNNFKVE